MKTTLNILKVSTLGLAILFGFQSGFAQKGETTSPKDKIKTEQSGKDQIKTGEGTSEGTLPGGKDDLKNGNTSGKDDLKNGTASGKDDIKNGTVEEGSEGSVEGSDEGHAGSHEGHDHASGVTSEHGRQTL